MSNSICDGKMQLLEGNAFLHHKVQGIASRALPLVAVKHVDLRWDSNFDSDPIQHSIRVANCA
jgi:hypothetical protein